MSENNDKKIKKVYGRRLGRPLNSERQKALEDLLPVLSIAPERITKNADIAPASLFQSAVKEIWFEIGFGNGEHLKAMMESQPDNGFIGAEPFINGMSAFLKSIKDLPHDNIRVHMDDALELLKSFTPYSLDGIYILNPDPWPKTRHHKRRIVNEDNLKLYARLLKPGGTLVMTTDVDDLAEWMLTKTFLNDDFEWQAEKADDWRTPPKDWPATRYEEKGKEAGRQQSYLIFKRRASPSEQKNK